MINVTKTYLPNKAKFHKYVDEIYANGWVTNNGPMVQKLETALAKYLGVKNIVLVSNGTVALEIAYRTLDLTGYAITTPFSFVATTSSLVTNGLKPIFADIDPNTFNIDPINIQKSITKNTSAIVPVHVFGNGCEVEQIDKIAEENNLKVIYDAAHAFDVKYKGQSILHYGDISTISFHATKLFHTIEGGALIINDDNLVQKARHLINFGIENAESIPSLGTNAKMNEFEAAMGLCVLDEIENIKNKREALHQVYNKELKGIVGFQEQNENSTSNHGYFPIILENEKQTLKIQKALNDEDIFPRRYFYPSLDTLNYIEPKQFMQNSRDISHRILCLPLYPELTKDEQMNIINIVKKGFMMDKYNIPHVKTFEYTKIIGLENIEFGKNIIIDDFVLIYAKEKIKIGNYVHIANFTSITGGNNLTIGDYAAVSQGCRILTATDGFNDFGFGNSTVANEFRNIKSSPIVISDFCIVGANSVVLPGVTIGEGATVGANSVITKDLEPWGIYIGNKKIGTRNKEKVLKNYENFLSTSEGKRTGSLFKK